MQTYLQVASESATDMYSDNLRDRISSTKRNLCMKELKLPTLVPFVGLRGDRGG